MISQDYVAVTNLKPENNVVFWGFCNYEGNLFTVKTASLWKYGRYMSMKIPAEPESMRAETGNSLSEYSTWICIVIGG